MPGAKFKRQAKDWKKLADAMVDEPFEMTKERIKSGMAEPCFITLELEDSADQSIDPGYTNMVKHVAAMPYIAGSDTTATTTASFFLAMMLRPEIQRKAQVQLDNVVGPNRLPQFSDRQYLTYIDCIIWEVLRWKPNTPIGLAHFSVKDDVYEGNLIPKGTTIFPNVWSIVHDEEAYPDPSAFCPDRFEDPKRNSELGINPLPDAVFGFGRRACPGRGIAFDTLWIMAASVLAVFNISKAVEADGTVIEPDTEYTTGLISRPKPFQCSLVPRLEGARELIRQIEDED